MANLKPKNILFGLACFMLLQTGFAGAKADNEALTKAAIHQQKAIYYFIQSMKNVKKRLANGKSKAGKQVKKEKNPFTKKQDFKRPKMPPEQNPQIKLQKIIKAQKLVLDTLTTAIKQAQTVEPIAPKQEAIGTKIAALNANHPLAKLVAETLQQAVKSSHAAANLLMVNNPKLAEIKVCKTLSDLKEALRKLNRASDRKFNKALTKAQQKVNDLANSPSDQEAETLKELNKLRDKLMKAAKAQHQSGRQKNAEKLADIAEEMMKKAQAQGKKNGQAGEKGTPGSKEQDGQKGKQGKQGKNSQGAGQGNNVKPTDSSRQSSLAEKLHELQTLIAKLRLEDKKDLQIVAESIEALKRYSKELKFLAKHPEASSVAEKQALLDDIELKMFDMMLGLKALTKNSPAPTKPQTADKRKNSTETAEDIVPKLQQLNQSVQAQVNKLKNRSSNQDNSKFALDNRIYPQKFLSLHDSLHEIVVNATLIIKDLQSTNLIYTFKPDDIPAKYRDDVAEYFERLSHLK